MEKYECPFVYWKETDYDVLSGHSSYEPVCTKECNIGKHCYKYNYTWCKYRYLDDKSYVEKQLKSCPFCDGEAELKHGKVYIDEIVFVRCKAYGCHARTDFVFINHPSLDPRTGKLDETTRYTIEQAENIAISRWNRRANDG